MTPSAGVFWTVAAGFTSTVAAARARRGRAFAIFAGIIFAAQGMAALALWDVLPVPWWVVAALQIAVAAHFVRLADPRMRSIAWRGLVSWPALWWTAGAILALPWAAAEAAGNGLPWPWLPWVAATFGLLQIHLPRRRTVSLLVDDAVVDGAPRRHPRGRIPDGARTLRIFQITDPHLGPFMSEARLRRICERAVAAEPDLVVLTGDYLTMESKGSGIRADGTSTLGRALAPLRAMEGRTFACFGNHDHEDPELVRHGLAEAGVRLLVDELAEVETPLGSVEILGCDYRFRGRAEHLSELAAQYPRRAGTPRIALLHDPGAFKHLPPGAGDLVLSGHTHGGQVGLVSLGLPWTAAGVFARIPDHGYWARGHDRLYVHLGTGHYGFPLRVGVPPMEGMLRVAFAGPVDGDLRRTPEGG